jgi:hypothetical protein
MARNIVYFLMENCSDELRLLFEREPKLKQAFNSWRLQELGAPDVDMSKYREYVRSRQLKVRTKAPENGRAVLKINPLVS